MDSVFANLPVHEKPQISAYGALVVAHRHAQRDENLVTHCTWCCAEVKRGDAHPACLTLRLWSVCYHVFCIFVFCVGILLFDMAPVLVLKCCLMFFNVTLGVP